MIEQETKSQFEKIVQEDFDQFRDISKRFQKVQLENTNELFEISKESWILATRWSEIQSNSRKIAAEYGLAKIDFQEWAYQKYRQLQEMHITTRSWFRLSKEEERSNNMSGVQ